MKCDHCGRKFDRQEALEKCRTSCRLYGACGLEPCPTCFEETVIEPAWYERIRLSA